ncbi:MAG: FKBP-type peptidyl-prolyl cis-trans isomerase [Firmicutes bacterium]|nr:FKBP-type peptidyl-prolyl cis-trans isomerase [Bacillota bacterium]
MKKVLAVLVIVIMTLGLFTACGDNTEAPKYTLDISPYDELDFSEYVKLPENFDSYEYKVSEVKVTDSDVETEIQARLEEASTETKEVTKGKVQEGDTVNIAFKGTLKDGSSPEGMNSDGTQIVLGSAGYIDGFEKGLYGAKIGDTVTLNLQFPDPYTVNTELSGQDVTFEVTILNKVEKVMKELDEEFIKEDTEGIVTTEEEYREYIKKMLQDYADSQMEYSAKQSLLESIINDCEVIQYPEEEVEKTKTRLIEQYQSYAEANQVEWADFLESQFGGEDSFNEQLDSYVREIVVSNSLKVYGLCKQADVSMTNEEYNEKIQEMFESFGVADEEEFQSTYNMSFENYLVSYDVVLNMYASKFLDKITGTGDYAEAESSN